MPKRSTQKKSARHGSGTSSEKTSEVTRKSHRSKKMNFVAPLEICEIKEEVLIDSDIECEDDSPFPHLTSSPNIKVARKTPNSDKLPFQCDLCHCGFSAQFDFFEHLKSHYDFSNSLSFPGAKQLTSPVKTPRKRSSKQNKVVPPKLKITESRSRSLSKGPSGSSNQLNSTEPGEFSCTKCRSAFLDKAHLSWHMADFHHMNEEGQPNRQPDDEQHNDSAELGSGITKRKSLRTIKKPTKFEVASEEESTVSDDPIVPDIEPYDREYQDSNVDSDYMEDEDGEVEDLEEEEVEETICPVCGEVYPSQNKLNLHTSVEHEEVEIKGHMCSTCGKTFQTTRKRTAHMKREHPNLEVVEMAADGKKEPKNKKKGSYPCTECDRVFHHRNSLSYHVKSHTGVRSHVCEICNKAFFATSALKVHLRIHSGQKPYGCEKCGRMFRQWGDLTYHMVSLHSEIRKYQCEYCGKDFARKYSLTVHRRIHTKECNYSCEFCTKSFRASSYLQNHRRIHTGEKPHKCDICGKPFRVKSDMKRHVASHSNKEQIRITDAQGVTTTTTITNSHRPRKPRPKSPPKPKPKGTEIVHNLVAVDESGQIIPLEPQIAKQLRAGQVIQVPVSSSSSNRITVKNSKPALITGDIPEDQEHSQEYEDHDDDGDTADDSGGDQDQNQEVQGAMYVWPVFMS